MGLDLDKTLATIKERQWALADIDWDAPGADLLSERQKEKISGFMADLVWIENIGARGFAAMAKKAPTDTLRDIYTYFHAEEQRHANAELALMRRWGMLDGDNIPEPNINVRLAIDWLDKYSDSMSLSVLGTVIPMLEVALDGALVKFLTDEVDDPICHEVFKLINADESRHLAVDFEVLDMLGHARMRKILIEFAGNVLSPPLLIGALMYIPLLNRMRDNIAEMGIDEERLYVALRRFANVGDRSAFTRRLPLYQVVKWQGALVINRKSPYHLAADRMVRLSSHYPRRLLRAVPLWSRELTFEPHA